MVDESRRGQLLTIKLTALARDHGAGPDLDAIPFALGAAATDGADGWVLLDDQPQRGLGPALAWAVRTKVERLQILAESGTGILARRAAAFRLPIEVWHIAERALLPAIAEPMPAPLDAPEEHDLALRPDLFVEGPGAAHERPPVARVVRGDVDARESAQRRHRDRGFHRAEARRWRDDQSTAAS